MTKDGKSFKPSSHPGHLHIPWPYNGWPDFSSIRSSNGCVLSPSIKILFSSSRLLNTIELSKFVNLSLAFTLANVDDDDDDEDNFVPTDVVVVVVNFVFVVVDDNDVKAVAVKVVVVAVVSVVVVNAAVVGIAAAAAAAATAAADADDDDDIDDGEKFNTAAEGFNLCDSTIPIVATADCNKQWFVEPFNWSDKDDTADNAGDAIFFVFNPCNSGCAEILLNSFAGGVVVCWIL